MESTVAIDAIIGLTIGLGTCFLCTCSVTKALRSVGGALSALLTRPTLVGAVAGLMLGFVVSAIADPRPPCCVPYYTFCGTVIGFVIQRTQHLWTT